MAEVRGQHLARTAIEVAVAGGHLLAGPPETGKAMLSHRSSSILPEMTRAEALETTKIYSALGLATGLIDIRPFRAPHHTISSAALIGDGSTPRPGEISLAHNGVLFFDELPEFARAAVEGLRQPVVMDVERMRRRLVGTMEPGALADVLRHLGPSGPLPGGHIGRPARPAS